MGRRILLNIGALALGILVSLGFLEVALRIYNPVIQTIKGETVVLRVNYDETRYNGRISGVASESHIHQNSLGFRGADPPGDFADRLSIISIGGSTTRSVTQSDDRTWTALLGDAVAECFDRTWINNAGFDGHSTFAHIELIRNYVKNLHPKVVLLLVGTNELFLDSDAYGLFRQIKRLIDAVATRSEIGALGLTLYRSFRAWKEGLNSPNLAEEEIPPGAAEGHVATAKRLQPDYAERLRLIIRLLREGGSIPVLLTQPTLGGIGRDPTTGKDLARLGHGLVLYQALEIYNQTMRHIAQSEDVYLIDLANLMPKDTKYYFDTMHYTDAGAKEVAQLISKELLPSLQQWFPLFNNRTCHLVSAKPS
jgi:GDSL-like Lipase/Acylhydrolase family